MRKKFISYILSIALVVFSCPVAVAKDTINEANLNSGSYTQLTTMEGVQVSSDYSAKIQVENIWVDGSGDKIYQAKLILTNNGTGNLNNWALKFNFKDQIFNIWNAQLCKESENEYLMKPMDYNKGISAGESIEIGFQATYIDEIATLNNYTYLTSVLKALESTEFNAQFKVTSEWEDGFNGEINITNNTLEPIEDWLLEFDYDGEINEFWTANLIEHTENHYVIKNKEYNAKIAPGETLTLGFGGGNRGTEASNYIVKTTELKEVADDKPTEEVDYLKDSDSDGLPDYLEELIGSNIYEADSDLDGLPDAYEYYIGLSPTLKDSDGNGILDFDEDFDSDGLNNKEEYELGTNPLSNDTDEDGLLDFEEVSTYKTNPTDVDTDKDGINDGDEIKLGLDPLNKYTHNGILDSEYKVNQTVTEDVIDLNKDEESYQLSVDIVASGNAESHLTVMQSDISCDNNSAIVGDILELEYNDGEVESATIKFKINEEVVVDTSDSETSEESLTGIKRFNLFRYYPDDNLLLPLASDFNEDTNTVSADVNVLGIYCLVDLNVLVDEFSLCTESNLDVTQQLIQNRTYLLNNGRANYSILSCAAASSVVVPQYLHNKYKKFSKTGNQYAVFDPPKNISWEEAKANCESYGGHLVTITSEEEQEFINDLVQKGEKYLYWIGGSKTSGSWQWCTGEPFDFQNFETEPASGNYLRMYRSTKFGNTGGTWHRQNNLGSIDTTQYPTRKCGYICEWEYKGKSFSYISANGLTAHTLDADLERYGETDTDDDTLTDSKEVNWSLMDPDGSLPSLGTLWAKHIGFVQQGKTLEDKILNQCSKEYKNKVLSQEVLPLFSDPDSKDGDKDGLNDAIDPQPLKYLANNFKIVNNFDYRYADQRVLDSKKLSDATFNTGSNLSYLELVGILSRTNANVLGGPLMQYPNAAKALGAFLGDNINGMTVYHDYINITNFSECIEKTSTGKSNFIVNITALMNAAEMIVPNTNNTYVIAATSERNATNFSSATNEEKLKYNRYDNDWWFTIGDSACLMVAKVTCSNNSYVMDVKYYLSDFYDWNEKDARGALVNDREMRELHLAGLAKQYEIGALVTTTIKWKKGERLSDLYKGAYMSKLKDESLESGC